MKQIILLVILLAGIIILAGYLSNGGNIPLPNKSPDAKKMVTIKEDVYVSAMIADTSLKRSRGLSGITKLTPNEGMLFVFDEKNEGVFFWMKNMIIPIDIIWIKDEKIIQIDKNVAPPEKGTPDEGLAQYTSSEIPDFVLEVNAGFSDANNISVGDLVKLPSL